MTPTISLALIRTPNFIIVASACPCDYLRHRNADLAQLHDMCLPCHAIASNQHSGNGDNRRGKLESQITNLKVLNGANEIVKVILSIGLNFRGKIEI
ncbi:hypothetical protein Ahy_B06g085130 isoform A [Arachis hypogaea]|uniref:Uncharacterized protein n=1 Tax=Arachis hypogaea TaxID=3818 RepID=A0A444YTM5_ARAHY|nr:hypothetical protein Ahy_B06g085130 isoform A [Arachis hypogaea]